MPTSRLCVTDVRKLDRRAKPGERDPGLPGAFFVSLSSNRTVVLCPFRSARVPARIKCCL
uniref:Uncharacterized protein n=1 Tax=Anopheles epiroticus TaxID=199890 RepID=A0A182PSV8_9DIPT